MKDKINETFGRGCYCKNCEFRVTRDGSEHVCRKGILVPNMIEPDTFCCYGIPKPQVEKHDNLSIVRDIQTLDKAFDIMREEIESGKRKHVSMRVILKNNFIAHITFEPGSFMYVRVDGLPSAIIPVPLRDYYEHGPCRNVPVPELIKIFQDNTIYIRVILWS